MRTRSLRRLTAVTALALASMAAAAACTSTTPKPTAPSPAGTAPASAAPSHNDSDAGRVYRPRQAGARPRTRSDEHPPEVSRHDRPSDQRGRYGAAVEAAVHHRRRRGAVRKPRT